MKISQSEKDFILSGITKNVRSDGRKRMDYRYKLIVLINRFITIETGVLPNANGSCKIKLWFPHSTIVVSVKAEVVSPSSDTPREGLINANVSYSPSAKPDYGERIENLNAYYTQKLLRYLKASNTLDLKKLCIIPFKFVWLLNIDVVIIESSGNVFDIITMGTYCALNDTRLPKTIEFTTSTEDVKDMSFDIDQDPTHCILLDALDMPICATLQMIGNYLVADCTTSEEQVGGATISVFVNRNNQICGVQKTGDESVEASALLSVLEVYSYIYMCI